jgi:NAD(P)-dependent dehydrogenase (short-subunit alcohol dehydrogenase family)
LKNILVLGGTRFFGRKLVELLLESGHHVTVVTRGQSGNPFGGKVEHLLVNRSIETAVGKQAKISLVGNNEIRSPYAIPVSWYMSNDKATNSGFQFTNLHDWLKPLIEEIASNIG